MIHQALTRCIPALTTIFFMILFPASLGSIAAGQTKAAGNTNAAPSQRRPLPEPADPKLPTLFLIGDSTVRNGQGDGANGQWGWGEPIVAFVDLNDIIAHKYEDLGPEKVELLFADANTHTTLAGAELNAACVITGIKRLTSSPLAAYLSARASEIEKH